MRDRFDQTNKEKDMRKLAAMVEEGEEELWKNQHYMPFIFKVFHGKSKPSIVAKFRKFTKILLINDCLISYLILERSRWYLISTSASSE